MAVVAPHPPHDLSDTTITIVSGSISGAVATIAKQPIQRIKWIRQVHLGDVASEVSYMAIVRQTIATDGVIGLFRGSFGAILRNVPHSCLVYSIYPHAEDLVQRWSPLVGGVAPEKGFAVRFWAGYLTLFSATLVTHPLDTLRVRSAVSTGVERGLWHDLKDIIAKEGVGVLYKGFTPTLIGAGPRGAIGFGIFETLKARTKEWKSCQDNPSMSKFMYGYLAGVLGETFVYPLDTVRRTQQAHGRRHAIGDNGWIQALQHLVKKRGFLSLFKGLSMNLFKNPIGTAVSFTVNDYVKEAMGYKGPSLSGGREGR